MSITDLMNKKGTTIVWHREADLAPCPCLTPEGFRDPTWHAAHPQAIVCTDAGFLPDPFLVNFKGFMQPISMGRTGRGSSVRQYVAEMFGDVRVDDYVGMFPYDWYGQILDFSDFSQKGDEWIEWNGWRFIIIAWPLIPDPFDTSKFHHWECLLRRINEGGV